MTAPDAPVVVVASVAVVVVVVVEENIIYLFLICVLKIINRC
jgi:hypothetical protein